MRQCFVKVAIEELAQCFRSVEAGDLPRAIHHMPDVVMPNHFAIGRIEERHAIFAELKSGLFYALGVPLGLRKNVLRSEGQFFRLNNPDYFAV